MKFDPSRYSDAGLAQLIEAASKELARRLIERGPEVITKPAQAKPPVIIDEPSGEEKQFVFATAEAARKSFVRSAERSRYKEIYARHESWFKSQRLPSDIGGSTGKKWAEFQGYVDAASSRLEKKFDRY